MSGVEAGVDIGRAELPVMVTVKYINEFRNCRMFNNSLLNCRNLGGVSYTDVIRFEFHYFFCVINNYHCFANSFFSKLFEVLGVSNYKSFASFLFNSLEAISFLAGFFCTNDFYENSFMLYNRYYSFITSNMSKLISFFNIFYSLTSWQYLFFLHWDCRDWRRVIKVCSVGLEYTKGGALDSWFYQYRSGERETMLVCLEEGYRV